MKNAALTPEITFAPIHEMAAQFEAFCIVNGWEIEDRKRASGGSMYYELCHSAIFSRVCQVRISNHPCKYGDDEFSVGDISLNELFERMNQSLIESSMKNLSIAISSTIRNFAA